MARKDTPLDELAILLKNPSHDLSVPVYDKRKKRGSGPVSTNGKKYTLNQIGDMVVGIKDDLKQVNTRLGNLEVRVSHLENDVKGINARLDYNGLKPLPDRK